MPDRETTTHGDGAGPVHRLVRENDGELLKWTGAYLNVELVGLEASMAKFDDSVARCKPVANEAAVERMPFGNATHEKAAQHQVNWMFSNITSP